MVMRACRHTVAIASFVGLLWTTGSPARATEQTNVPSFHRVVVVNETSPQTVVPTESGLITAALETRQADGQWRAVAKLKAPIGTNQSIVFRAGEIWQFIVPGSATGFQVKGRLALRLAGGTVYSQPFDIRVDPLSARQTMDCWLARIQPVHAGLGPVIAGADRKRGS